MNTKSKGIFIINAIMTILFFLGGLLWAAGDWVWLEGWLFGLWFEVMVLSNMIYLFRHDPALLAERARMPGGEDQKTWDKYLLTGAYISALVWYFLMPLDAVRFGWSPPFPLGLKILGGIMLLPALYFIYQATVENTFLSTRVRIQAERNQRVISTGVYGFVRHPLYLGCLLMLFGAPLLLGSLFGLGIGAFACVVLVVRIVGEEKMLVEELEGYAAYRNQVPFRLFPYIW